MRRRLTTASRGCRYGTVGATKGPGTTWRGWSSQTDARSSSVTSAALPSHASVRSRTFPKTRSWFALGAPLELLSPLSVLRILFAVDLVAWPIEGLVLRWPGYKLGLLIGGDGRRRDRLVRFALGKSSQPACVRSAGPARQRPRADAGLRGADLGPGAGRRAVPAAGGVVHRALPRLAGDTRPSGGGDSGAGPGAGRTARDRLGCARGRARVTDAAVRLDDDPAPGRVGLEPGVSRP